MRGDEILTWKGESSDGAVRWECHATREQLLELKASLDALLGGKR